MMQGLHIFIFYKNALITEWRKLPHGSIPFSTNYSLDMLLYVNDQLLLANSVDDLQISVHNLSKIAQNYETEISVEKIEVFAFRAKGPIPRKFV